MNKNEIRSVLFLGVGGVSMYQLASTFNDLGLTVYGYDAKANGHTKFLESKGIKVVHKFDKSVLVVDLCIKTGAIKDDNKFVRFFKKANIPILDRAKVLGWLCTKFDNVVAVAGTHGKSTTATLIYEMLRAGGKKVSCHIGADIDSPRFNIGDDYLVVEACEYNKSFLAINPTISVVTNIEAEHMDSYNSIFDLRSSFVKFLRNAKTKFVYNGESTKFLTKYRNINFVNINHNLHIKLHGEHNRQNASLAVAVASSLGIDTVTISRVLKTFDGVARRYENIGNYYSSKVYIDYAHHPTEIKAFLDTFNEDYPNNLIIFQPHTYSRTKMFIKEFLTILSKQKNLIIYKEYPARETASQGLTAKELYHELKKLNENVQYAGTLSGLKKKIGDFDAISFVGAGDIDTIARKIIKTNQKNT